MNAVGMLSTKKDQSEELGDCIQRIGSAFGMESCNEPTV